MNGLLLFCAAYFAGVITTAIGVFLGCILAESEKKRSRR
jgi:hypothetical protein